MRTIIRKTKNYTALLALGMVTLLSSCAAGNVIEPNMWLGAADVAAGVGIAIFILRGSAK